MKRWSTVESGDEPTSPRQTSERPRTSTGPAAALPDLLRSLGDPVRLRLLAALRSGELAVGELATVLGSAQSGVSRHLAILRAAGLVEDRREGTSSLFRLSDMGGRGGAATLWPAVEPMLDALPEARADAARLERVLEARSSRSFAYFQGVAPHWDSIRAAQYGDDLRSLALLELIPPDMTVLDVGTGTGFMLVGLASRVRHLIGIDASPAMLEKARENLASAGVEDADLRTGSMEKLPLDDACVDAVLANMALHHAAEPRAALCEFARVLRPGGRVVLTDLAQHEHAWTRQELADEWQGFSPADLRDGLEAAGFVDVSVRSVGTCTLARAGTRERHGVEVLLATGRKTVRAVRAPRRQGKALKGS